MGGKVALFLAAEIPSKVRAIIVEDSPLPFYKTKSEYAEKENLKEMLIFCEQYVESGFSALSEDELLTFYFLAC